MNRFVVAILSAAIVVGLIETASPFGGLGREFGKLGASKKTAAVSAPSSCSGTGLIFTASCNSQYIGTL